MKKDKYIDTYGNCWFKIGYMVWNKYQGWGLWDGGKGLTKI